ncbi:hypothetical protein BRARA_I05094 [Brassica rapa]|uniref:Pentacotripeptide-repeat region of PRORP domain-containing protein n=1 Tax=Brassica campestris TaxID=3711 RepID=A0A397Y4N8_BRACM|nr:hypothetical protein BRARA_I05094 [Brassica rapa]
MMLMIRIRSAKALRSVRPLLLETAGTLRTPYELLSFVCERTFSGGSDRNRSSYKERLRSGIIDIKKDDVVALFQSMIRSRPLPTVIDFNRLFTAMAKTKQYDLVLDLCKQMELNGVAHNMYTLNIMINCFCRRWKLGFAFSVMGKILKLGYEPDRVTFNTLLNGLCLEGGFCSVGKWDDGAQLLRDMIRREITPNAITFSSLIDSFVKVGKLSEAQDLYNEMIKRGTDPDTITYNSLIYGLCMEKRLDEAREMLDLMVSKGCDPDIVTYSILINGYCKAKLVDEGMRLFRKMSVKGVVANTVTYSTLIQGFCQSGKLNVAKELFQEMVSEGVHPNTMTYGILLDGLCDNGEVEEAMEILEKMHYCKIDPGIGIYTIIIHGMCNANKVDDAWDLFCSLSLKGVKRDIRSYNIMLSGLYASTVKIVMDMLSSGELNKSFLDMLSGPSRDKSSSSLD